MSMDNRLRYLWELRLGKVEPPPQQEPPSIASEGHSQGRDDPGHQGPLPSVDIGLPVGSISPTEKSEARAQRAERRDERRLWVEMAALALGFFGLIGLLLTLQASRWATEAALQSMVTARSQLELSERPWVTVNVTPARPFKTGGGLVEFEVSLKNVGRSVAIDISVEAEIMLYPRPSKFILPHPGPDEIDTRRENLCGKIRRFVTAAREGEGLILFPEQQGTIRIEQVISQEDIEGRAFEEPPNTDIFIDPVLIGCVMYESTFTTRSHVTGFTYFVSFIHHRRGYLRVGDPVPIEDIRLKPYNMGNYID